MPTSPTVIRTRDDIVRDAAFMDLNTKRSKVLQKRLGFAIVGGSLSLLAPRPLKLNQFLWGGAPYLSLTWGS